MICLPDRLIASQLVELRVDAVAREAAVARERRRLVDECRLDELADVGQIVELRRSGERTRGAWSSVSTCGAAGSTRSDCFSADEIAWARRCQAQLERPAAPGPARP